MVINIIIEPEYKDTVWCRETLCGIDKKAALLHYKTMIHVAKSTENTPVEFSKDCTVQKNPQNNIYKDDEQFLEIQALEKTLKLWTKYMGGTNE